MKDEGSQGSILDLRFEAPRNLERIKSFYSLKRPYFQRLFPLTTRCVILILFMWTTSAVFNTRISRSPVQLLDQVKQTANLRWTLPTSWDS